MHEYVVIAASKPTQMAKNFMYAPKKNSILKSWPSVVIDFVSFISLAISFTASDKCILYKRLL